jgi:hypothetical protein
MVKMAQLSHAQFYSFSFAKGLFTPSASNPKIKSGWKILISDLRTHLRELGDIFPSEKNARI